MPSLTNKTQRPLAVPLPGGKKLRLGPGKTGQVTAKALDFPAVKKLIEAGDVEAGGEDRKRGSASGGITPATAREGPTIGGIQRSGDR